MRGGGIDCSRRLVHKDFLYLSLYRVCRACVRESVRLLRRQMSLVAAYWQSYLWWVVDAIARIPAIFGKRPQFCPILVKAWRMNLEDHKKILQGSCSTTGADAVRVSTLLFEKYMNLSHSNLVYTSRGQLRIIQPSWGAAMQDGLQWKMSRRMVKPW